MGGWKNKQIQTWLFMFSPELIPPLLCPSASHSACVMQERKIYVFGGWDTPVCYNDMYMLDLGEHSRHWKSKQTHV